MNQNADAATVQVNIIDLEKFLTKGQVRISITSSTMAHNQPRQLVVMQMRIHISTFPCAVRFPTWLLNGVDRTHAVSGQQDQRQACET